MKYLLLNLTLCLALIQAAANDQPANQYICLLDQAIADREKYMEIKKTRIDSLRRQFAIHDDTAKYHVCNKLVVEYMNYSLDSALAYAKQGARLARKAGDDNSLTDAYMNIARIYNLTGLMPKEAFDILKNIDRSTLGGEYLVRYYILALQIYDNLAKQAFDSEISRRYERTAQLYRDSALHFAPGNEIILANKYIEEGNYEMARSVVCGGLSDDMTGSDAAARFHVLARIYGLQNNVSQRKKYLALAARCDMVNGAREYMALQELAQMLYDDGDTGRAYRYIHQSISDAIACNARSRMLEMSKTIPIIDADYNRKQAETNLMLYAACACIGVLSVLLLVIAIYVHKRNRKLSAAKQLQEELNRQLELGNNEQQQLNERLQALNENLLQANRKWQSMNVELQQANRIKEEYVTQFMNLCSEYLSKMESYRNNLLKIASQRNFDRLYDAVKSNRELEKEINDFYAKFDEAFLHLFPAFVDDFNKLLLPECQIKPKHDERLNTELRIFALQRLGITDSEKVAKFLRCSFSTIYNYRTKMKNRAIDRDDFEEKIMNLC